MESSRLAPSANRILRFIKLYFFRPTVCSRLFCRIPFRNNQRSNALHFPFGGWRRGIVSLRDFPESFEARRITPPFLRGPFLALGAAFKFAGFQQWSGRKPIRLA